MRHTICIDKGVSLGPSTPEITNITNVIAYKPISTLVDFILFLVQPISWYSYFTYICNPLAEKTLVIPLVTRVHSHSNTLNTFGSLKLP